jgi:hypothetical protein
MACHYLRTRRQQDLKGAVCDESSVWRVALRLLLHFPTSDAACGYLARVFRWPEQFLRTCRVVCISVYIMSCRLAECAAALLCVALVTKHTDYVMYTVNRCCLRVLCLHIAALMKLHYWCGQSLVRPLTTIRCEYTRQSFQQLK